MNKSKALRHTSGFLAENFATIKRKLSVLFDGVMSVATYSLNFAVVNKVNWLSSSTVLYFAAVFNPSTQEFFHSRITTFKVRTDKFSKID